MLRRLAQMRKNVSSGTLWEPIVGYSWLVEAGSFMVASSTISIDENDDIIGRGNSYKQIKYVMQKIEKTLKWQT